MRVCVPFEETNEQNLQPVFFVVVLFRTKEMAENVFLLHFGTIERERFLRR